MGLGVKDVVNPATVVSFKFKVANIACGYWHTLLLSAEGRVYATGYNKTGGLGLGDTVNRSTFTEITTIKGEIEISGSEFEQAVLEKITQIAAGYHVSFFIDESKKLYSCGSLYLNGMKKVMDVDVPRLVDYSLYFSLSNIISLNLKIPKLQDKAIVSVAVGAKHAACIDSEGLLYTWGDGGCYELGHGKNVDLKC